MRTFRQTWEEKQGDFLSVLKAADRSYLADNLDPSSEGRYLEDFLRLHGDEPVRAIKFGSGSPATKGTGIVFIPAPWTCYECGGVGNRLSLLDGVEKTVHITCTEHNRYGIISMDDAKVHYPDEIRKLRRQVEDRLRKNSDELFAVAALLAI
jgi:hypothetical protein